MNESAEAYGLNWVGKAEAWNQADRPASGTLHLDAQRSWPGEPMHQLIEGDNLEVLKNLRQTHPHGIRLVYLDPPYNTGNAFAYADSRGTAEDRHSDWLSMMAPRLVLMKELLSDDGVLVVSIDGHEVHQLALLLDEVFGSANRVNMFTWINNLKGRQLGGSGAVGTHEYLLVYARQAARVGQFRARVTDLNALMPSIYRRTERQVHHDSHGPYVVKNRLHNTNSRFNEVSAPTLVYRIHYHPETGQVRVTDIDDDTTFDGFTTVMPHPNARDGLHWHAWRWSRARVLAEPDQLHFEVRPSGVQIYTKVRDIDGTALKDVILGPSTATGLADLAAAGLARVFDAPKPVALIQLFVAAITSGEDLVADFFAGSGTTLAAVAEQNRADGGRRRCLLVQNAEPTRPGSEARRVGFDTVFDITLARVKQVCGQQDPPAGLQVVRLG